MLFKPVETFFMGFLPSGGPIDSVRSWSLAWNKVKLRTRVWELPGYGP